MRAKTRTLMAYGISHELALRILSTSQNYALPADMHLQIILQNLNIGGLSISESPFSHASKTGKYRSSTE